MSETSRSTPLMSGLLQAAKEADAARRCVLFPIDRGQICAALRSGALLGFLVQFLLGFVGLEFFP
jgi:hypothetical protein